MQYNCRHKEFALQNALRYDFALLNLSVKIPFLLMICLREFSDKKKILDRLKFTVGSCPLPLTATTPLR